MLGALVLALGVALLVQGYTHHLGSASATTAVPSTASTENVPRGGARRRSRHRCERRRRAHRRPARADDRPDLRRRSRPDVDAAHPRGARASTTCTRPSSSSARRRSIIPTWFAECVDEGHEIGVHTLTHADLGSAPRWQQELELQGSQQAIVGITGSKAAADAAAVQLRERGRHRRPLGGDPRRRRRRAT